MISIIVWLWDVSMFLSFILIEINSWEDVIFLNLFYSVFTLTIHIQLRKEGRRNEYERHKLQALNQRQKMVRILPINCAFLDPDF